MNHIIPWQKRMLPVANAADAIFMEANCKEAEINDLRAHIKALEDGELPEPEITLKWDSWDEAWVPDSLASCMKKTEENRIIGYTADQLRQAIAKDRIERNAKT